MPFFLFFLIENQNAFNLLGFSPPKLRLIFKPHYQDYWLKQKQLFIWQREGSQLAEAGKGTCERDA